jgi:hypothetical protein
MLNSPPRRDPEAPRFHQRGEGSRANHDCAIAGEKLLLARSLARLKTAALRDDAFFRATSIEQQVQREGEAA